MTAVLPELDLSGLDFDPTCDAYRRTCPQEAEWRLELHCSGCDRRVLLLFCTAHKQRIEQDVRRLVDLQCGKRAPIVLDTVEPLR